MTTLQVARWQRVVEHRIAAAGRVTLESLAENVTPDVVLDEPRCITRLPSLLCSCRRYFIEAVDDGQAPLASGYGGDIG